MSGNCFILAVAVLPPDMLLLINFMNVYGPDNSAGVCARHRKYKKKSGKSPVVVITTSQRQSYLGVILLFQDGSLLCRKMQDYSVWRPLSKMVTVVVSGGVIIVEC